MLSFVSDVNDSQVVTAPVRPRLAASMARRRQQILDAAVSLFHERGYLGTTVDDVAARAGVTKRTLYHHMGSKENLLGEIHAGFIEEGLRRWEAIVDAGGTAVETLSALIEEHVRIVGLNREAIGVFFEEAKHLSATNRAEIEAQRDNYEALLRATIARGVNSGEFRSDLDVNVVTLLILGGLTEMYRWYQPKTRTARETVIALCKSLALEGVDAG